MILIESDLNRNSTMSYAEWDAGRNGDLWKDRYRNDIRNVASIAHNWDEFVTILRQAGYQIDDSRKYVTYHFLKPDPDDKRSYRLVRDKTLGLDFTREALAREYDWNSPDQTYTPCTEKSREKAAGSFDQPLFSDRAQEIRP